MAEKQDTEATAPAEPTSPLLAKDSGPGHTSRKPSIDTSTPAINETPIELDSTPVSPATSTKRADSWPVRRNGSVASPDVHDAVYGELSGSRDETARVRDQRSALLDRRRQDAGVLVDIPDTPDAEDFEAAEGARVADKAAGAGKS